MSDYDWAERFREVHAHAVRTCESGKRDPEAMFDRGQVDFLRAIGCSPQEVYDFAEDWCSAGEPAGDTVLLITAVRRDYFLQAQGGKPPGRAIAMDRLPPKDAALGGLPWLPRIIEKARAKLRGEMPPELMYGCGGDRAFLMGVGMHPADFLRLVWAAGADTQRIVDQVLKRSR
jgi:hypothetical protein